MPGLEAGKCETPNRQQTECLLTNRLSYRGSSKNLNSTARSYDEWAFSPLHSTADWLSRMTLAIYMSVIVNFHALAQARYFRIERRRVVFLGWMQDSKLQSLGHQIACRLNAHPQTDWAIKDQARTWTHQPVLMMSEHSAHLTSLPNYSSPMMLKLVVFIWLFEYKKYYEGTHLFCP